MSAGTPQDGTGSILRGLRKAPNRSVVNDIVNRKPQGGDGQAAPAEAHAEVPLTAQPAQVEEPAPAEQPTPRPAVEAAAPPVQQDSVQQPAAHQAAERTAQAAQAQPSATPVEHVPVPAPPAPAAQQVQHPGAPVPVEGPEEKRSKMTFYQSEADIERMKASYLHTVAYTGHEHQTEFIEEAIRRYCRQLEAAHNDGEPFPVKPRRRRR